jgi:hypothetical protein
MMSRRRHARLDGEILREADHAARQACRADLEAPYRESTGRLPDV